MAISMAAVSEMPMESAMRDKSSRPVTVRRKAESLRSLDAGILLSRRVGHAPPLSSKAARVPVVHLALEVIISSLDDRRAASLRAHPVLATAFLPRRPHRLSFPEPGLQLPSQSELLLSVILNITPSVSFVKPQFYGVN